MKYYAKKHPPQHKNTFRKLNLVETGKVPFRFENCSKQLQFIIISIGHSDIYLLITKAWVSFLYICTTNL